MQLLLLGPGGRQTLDLGAGTEELPAPLRLQAAMRRENRRERATWFLGHRSDKGRVSGPSLSEVAYKHKGLEKPRDVPLRKRGPECRQGQEGWLKRGSTAHAIRKMQMKQQ